MNLAAAAALPLAPPGSLPPPKPPSRPPHLVHRDIVGTPHKRIKDFVDAVLLAGAFAVAAVGLATAPMLLYNLKMTRQQKMWSEVVDRLSVQCDSRQTVSGRSRQLSRNTNSTALSNTIRRRKSHYYMISRKLMMKFLPIF